MGAGQVTRVGPWDGISCFTCGGAPIGTFNDGSPRFGPDHPSHPPIVSLEDDGVAAMALVITLDEREQKQVQKVATKVGDRYRLAKTAAMKYRPTGRSIADVNLDGFGAELAVAKWTGAEWHRGNRRKCDVGDDIEVRNVRRQDGLLALYTFDNGKRRFVLVTGRFPRYRLAGWLVGKEGMTEERWHPKGAIVAGHVLDYPRFLIPQQYLRPMHEFVRTDLTAETQVA